MGNKVLIGNSMRRSILALLQHHLPTGWKSGQRVVQSTIRPRSAFLLTLESPDAARAVFAVEVRAGLEPRGVAVLAPRLQAGSKALGSRTLPLVAAPFLSLSTRQRLAELGISYLDLTGNIRIVSSRPGLCIAVQGEEHNPDWEGRAVKSLKGTKAGRIVRALCDAKPPFAVRKLAVATSVSPGYVSRVLAFLESEDLILREGRGPITEVRWRKLIERWARDHSFMESNRVVAYLEPRDIDTLPSRLAAASKRLAITGAAAAASVAPVAPTRLLTAYVESPEMVAAQLGLRTAESGANVLLAEPYDSVVFERTRRERNVPYVALSQAAVDLLGGPGRGPAEAHALLEWMETNESAWRS